MGTDTKTALRSIDYRGVTRNGSPMQGQIETRDVAAFVLGKYLARWRELEVYPAGTLREHTPRRSCTILGAIERGDDGVRTWWAGDRRG